MTRRKLGEEFKVSYNIMDIFTQATIANQEANFYYEKFTEKHHQALRLNAKFWNHVEDENEIPKSAIMEYNKSRNTITTKKGETKKEELGKRDIAIKQLELEIEILKKRLNNA